MLITDIEYSCSTRYWDLTINWIGVLGDGGWGRENCNGLKLFLQLLLDLADLYSSGVVVLTLKCIKN